MGRTSARGSTRFRPFHTSSGSARVYVGCVQAPFAMTGRVVWPGLGEMGDAVGGRRSMASSSEVQAEWHGGSTKTGAWTDCGRSARHRPLGSLWREGADGKCLLRHGLFWAGTCPGPRVKRQGSCDRAVRRANVGCSSVSGDRRVTRNALSVSKIRRTTSIERWLLRSHMLFLRLRTRLLPPLRITGAIRFAARQERPT